MHYDGRNLSVKVVGNAIKGKAWLCCSSFLIIDWVMKRTVMNNGVGIRWKLMANIDDCDFINDLVLLSGRWSHNNASLQKKVLSLNVQSRGEKRNSTTLKKND